jgi:hypothetical protein
MCTTLLGLCFLGYSLLTSPTTATTDLLIHFIPRFSFALLIEVFAYFFLQLYKKSLGEIKYFQNELTNVESRALAAQIARHANDPDLMIKIALNLASTERNFVLERGQSTVDLERERISQATNEKLLDALSATLRGKKPGLTVTLHTLPEYSCPMPIVAAEVARDVVPRPRPHS